MSIRLDETYRDNGGRETSLLATGATRDEWKNRRCTVIGLAVCLRANGTAAGQRPAPTAAGSSTGSRGHAGGPFRPYPEGKLRRPAEVVARRSRRRVDVLYWLSVG